jgi:hypothetical protein
MSEHKWSEFIGVLHAVKECSILCPYYKTCAMVPYAPVCMVKEMCDDDLRRYFKLFILGEEGLRSEIMNSLFELGGLVDKTDQKQLSNYVEQLLKVNRQVYGDKKPVRDDLEDFKIEVTSRGFEKKIPTIVLNEEEDPESLLYSPNLDKITAGS